jgi:hypothetical protein
MPASRKPPARSLPTLRPPLLQLWAHLPPLPLLRQLPRPFRRPPSVVLPREPGRGVPAGASPAGASMAGASLPCRPRLLLLLLLLSPPAPHQPLQSQPFDTQRFSNYSAAALRSLETLERSCTSLRPNRCCPKKEEIGVSLSLHSPLERIDTRVQTDCTIFVFGKAKFPADLKDLFFQRPALPLDRVIPGGRGFLLARDGRAPNNKRFLVISGRASPPASALEVLRGEEEAAW